MSLEKVFSKIFRNDSDQYVEDDRGNVIHNTAIIGKDVKLGLANYIGPYCVIVGDTSIGDENRFEGHCSIGTPPESKLAWIQGEEKGTRIGHKCVFREFTTVNAGWKNDTFLCNRITMLRGAHVGHCAFIANDVSIHCNVIVGGHATILHGAYIGLGAVLNPKALIGPYALIGSQSVCLDKTKFEPFKKYAGIPAKEIGDNEKMARERHGLDEMTVQYLKNLYEAEVKHDSNRV